VFPQNQQRGRGGDGMVHLFTPQFGEGKFNSFEMTEEVKIFLSPLFKTVERIFFHEEKMSIRYLPTSG
jgi:hypothetical protein